MANSVEGRVHEIGKIETVTTKVGTTFEKQELVLDTSRYDTMSGVKGYDNFVVLEFNKENVKKLVGLNKGDIVKVSFELTGYQYTNQQNEVKYITRARGYNLEVKPTQESRQQVEQAPQVAQPQKGGGLPF